MDAHSSRRYKTVRRDGIVAILVRRRRLLLLRRPNIPLIFTAPGIWTFVTGGRKRGESHIETAYREVLEETGIGRGSLHLIKSAAGVGLFDPVYRTKMWRNHVFIFRAKTGKVRLNIENREYRWAAAKDVLEEKRYSNIFVERRKMERLILSSLE